MNTSYYVVYASILVGIAAKFGFVVIPTDAQTVVAAVGIVVGAIWSHVNNRALVAQARMAGMHI